MVLEERKYKQVLIQLRSYFTYEVEDEDKIEIAFKSINILLTVTDSVCIGI